MRARSDVQEETRGFVQQTARSWLAEFIGTFFLVVTVGLNVVNRSVGTALAVGAMLTSMIYAVGPISGAHLNPAVTVAVILKDAVTGRKFDARFLGYIVVQLFSGLCAGNCFFLLSAQSFALEPVGRYNWATAAMLEMIYTGALCYVVLCVTCDAQKGRHYAGMAIGFTVTAAALAIGGITGCSLNPAVSMGIFAANVWYLGFYAACSHLWLYLTAPLLGSVLGVGMYLLVEPGFPEVPDDCPTVKDLTPRSMQKQAFK